jgi:hypothetical protein
VSDLEVACKKLLDEEPTMEDETIRGWLYELTVRNLCSYPAGAAGLVTALDKLSRYYTIEYYMTDEHCRFKSPESRAEFERWRQGRAHRRKET